MKKMPMKLTNWTYIPWPTMVTTSPNFECDFSKGHTFHNPCFTICTIHSTNMSTLRWSHEIVWWSIDAFSHKYWKSFRNFIPWLVKTSVGTPNLLNMSSRNAYVAFSLLQSSNGTNSNQLEKCSIITITYWLCQDVKLNGLTKSKLYW